MVEDPVKGCLNVIDVLKDVLPGIRDAKIPNAIEVSMKGGGVIYCWAFVLMACRAWSWNICVRGTIVPVRNSTGRIHT
jgi:hypothetical protein